MTLTTLLQSVRDLVNQSGLAKPDGELFEFALLEIGAAEDTPGVLLLLDADIALSWSVLGSAPDSLRRGYAELAPMRLEYPAGRVLIRGGSVSEQRAIAANLCVIL